MACLEITVGVGSAVARGRLGRPAQPSGEHVRAADRQVANPQARWPSRRMLAPMPCPSCGAAIPTGSRYCPSCGHALSIYVDERRVVTVLFGDLVGFTAMAETLDPEAVKVLVDRGFERLVRDIVEFGGRVDKILGDAIVALFGAPVAHEDDAERAGPGRAGHAADHAERTPPRSAPTSRCASA